MGFKSVSERFRWFSKKFHGLSVEIPKDFRIFQVGSKAIHEDFRADCSESLSLHFNTIRLNHEAPIKPCVPEAL